MQTFNLQKAGDGSRLSVAEQPAPSEETVCGQSLGRWCCRGKEGKEGMETQSPGLEGLRQNPGQAEHLGAAVVPERPKREGIFTK